MSGRWYAKHSQTAQGAQLLENVKIVQDFVASAAAGESPSSSLLQAIESIHSALEVSDRTYKLTVLLCSTPGAAKDIVRLIERFASSDSDDVKTKLVLEATRTLTELWSAKSSVVLPLQVLDESGCVPVMVSLMQHERLDVRIQAIQCLTKIAEQCTEGLDALRKLDEAVGRLVVLLDSTPTTTMCNQETAALAQFACGLLGGKRYLKLELAHRLVPGMSKLLDEQIAALNSNQVDETILLPVLECFNEMFWHSVNDSSILRRTIDLQVQRQAALLFQQPMPPSPPIALAAYGILQSPLSWYPDIFIDVGGLVAIQAILRNPQHREDVLRLVTSDLQDLGSNRGQGGEGQQRLIDCDGLIWDICHTLRFETDPRDKKQTFRDERFSDILSALLHNSPPELVRQAVEKQHLLHAMMLSFTVKYDYKSSQSHDVIYKLVDRVGLPFLQEYARGLLQRGEFFPLVDKFRFNVRTPQTVFSAVVRNCQCNADVVQAMLLVGVNQTELVVKPRWHAQASDHRPEIYQRYRQAQVMVALCSTRTVARRWQHVAGSLPEELWRMLHEMLCEYSTFKGKDRRII